MCFITILCFIKRNRGGIFYDNKILTSAITLNVAKGADGDSMPQLQVSNKFMLQ